MSIPALDKAFATLPCSANTAINLKYESEFEYRFSSCCIKGMSLYEASSAKDCNFPATLKSFAISRKSLKALVTRLVSMTPNAPSSRLSFFKPSSSNVSVFAAIKRNVSTKSELRARFPFCARAIPLPVMFLI